MLLMLAFGEVIVYFLFPGLDIALHTCTCCTYIPSEQAHVCSFGWLLGFSGTSRGSLNKLVSSHARKPSSKVHPFCLLPVDGAPASVPHARQKLTEVGGTVHYTCRRPANERTDSPLSRCTRFEDRRTKAETLTPTLLRLCCSQPSTVPHPLKAGLPGTYKAPRTWGVSRLDNIDSYPDPARDHQGMDPTSLTEVGSGRMPELGRQDPRSPG